VRPDIARAISVVKADGKGYLIESGWVTAITLPDGTRDWEAEGAGDPTRPLIRVVNSAGEPHHYRVEPDGTLVPVIAGARTGVALDLLALTATNVFGTSGGSSWRRDLGAQGLGGESSVNGVVSAASAARVLVDRGSGVQCLDGDVLGPVIAAGSGTLSGPYVPAANAVLTVAGASLPASHPQAVFGSLVVEDSLTTGDGYRVQVRDVTGVAQTVEVQLSTGGDEVAPAKLWGDWVGATFASTADMAGGKVTELRNLRTGAARTSAGELVGLGDGFAVVARATTDASRALVAVDLTSGAESVLTRATASAALAVDAGRVAFVEGTDLVVMSVNGAGTSAPRLLGALASGRAMAGAPWTVALDLTKPVAAGTLAIRSAGGAVVRSLPTPSSASGSLRGLAWDGRDDAGARVGPGAYSWEYRAEASDGTGAVRDVTGQHAPAGVIRVR